MHRDIVQKVFSISVASGIVILVLLQRFLGSCGVKKTSRQSARIYYCRFSQHVSKIPQFIDILRTQSAGYFYDVCWKKTFILKAMHAHLRPHVFSALCISINNVHL